MRREAAFRLGSVGAALGMVAGVVQAAAGQRIPEWTGAKAAPGQLGSLTVALSVLAGFAAVAQRRPGLSVRARAACALGLAVPGLLCLSTVGRLWFVPAVLLLAAAVFSVGSWRETGRVVWRDRFRVLLSALGGCELLMATGSSPWLAVVGAVGGFSLVAAAWVGPPRPAVGCLLVGAVPFAVLGRSALVPLLLPVLAVALFLPITSPLFRPRRRERPS